MIPYEIQIHFIPGDQYNSCWRQFTRLTNCHRLSQTAMDCHLLPQTAMYWHRLPLTDWLFSVEKFKTLKAISGVWDWTLPLHALACLLLLSLVMLVENQKWKFYRYLVLYWNLVFVLCTQAAGQGFGPEEERGGQYWGCGICNWQFDITEYKVITINKFREIAKGQSENWNKLAKLREAIAIFKSETMNWPTDRGRY